MKSKLSLISLSLLLSPLSFASVDISTSSNVANPVIESTGGKVKFHSSILNSNAIDTDIRYYDYLIFPDQQIYSRAKAKNITLIPGEQLIKENEKIKITAAFPDGDYQYVLAVFDKKTGEIKSSSFPFKKKSSFGTLGSCNDILENGASTGDGYYTIDPDGNGPVTEFSVYCDMTNQGGGWTLFANHKDGIIDTVATPEVNLESYSVLQADRWNALKENMTQGMLFVDENKKVSAISVDKIMNGSCRSIDTVVDLKNITPLGKNMTIWHDEDSGCDFTGTDYSDIILGDSNTNIVTAHGASIRQQSTSKFDIWPYKNNWSYDAQDELLYFIK